MKAKDTVIPVPDHSESIWCPHCGEEFGIESRIEQAHEFQAELSFKAGRESMVREVQRIRAEGRKDVLALLGNNYPDEARAIRHTLRDRN